MKQKSSVEKMREKLLEGKEKWTIAANKIMKASAGVDRKERL